MFVCERCHKHSDAVSQVAGGGFHYQEHWYCVPCAKSFRKFQSVVMIVGFVLALGLLIGTAMRWVR